MTQKTYLEIVAAINPNAEYKGMAFFKNQKPRDFRGSLLINEIKSIKGQLTEDNGQKLLAGLKAPAAPAAPAESPKKSDKADKSTQS